MTTIDTTPTNITYWTKERFNEAVKEHHADMKQHGWRKSDAKRDIINMMKDNNIKIKK